MGAQDVKQIEAEDLQQNGVDSSSGGQPEKNGLFHRVIAYLAAKVGIEAGVIREAGWSFGIKTTSTGLNFLATVLLVRVLGAEGYGIYAYAYAWMMMLSMPAQSGLPDLIVRETARGVAAHRPDRVKGAWIWAGRVVAVLSLIIVLGAGPFLVAWQGGWHSSRGQTMAWALALVPLMALGNLRGAALRGMGQIVVGQLPEFVIRPGFFLLLLVGGMLGLGRPFSAPLAMGFQVAASLMAFLIGAWLLVQRTPPAVRQASPVVESRGWLVSSITFALITGFSVVNNQIGTIILGMLEAPEKVGIFRVAAQVATLAAFGLQAVNMVVAPRFASLYAERKMDRLQQLATGSARIVLASSVLLTGIFLIAGRPFFQKVFGAEFNAAYAPLLILLAGQTVNAMAGSVGFLLNMTGHERDTAKGMGIAVVSNLILNLVLVPRWGVEGAAAATAVSMALWNGLLWWRVRQRLGINSLAFVSKKKK